MCVCVLCAHVCACVCVIYTYATPTEFHVAYDHSVSLFSAKIRFTMWRWSMQSFDENWRRPVNVNIEFQSSWRLVSVLFVDELQTVTEWQPKRVTTIRRIKSFNSFIFQSSLFPITQYEMNIFWEMISIDLSIHCFVNFCHLHQIYGINVSLPFIDLTWISDNVMVKMTEEKWKIARTWLIRLCSMPMFNKHCLC